MEETIKETWENRREEIIILEDFCIKKFEYKNRRRGRRRNGKEKQR